MMNKHVKHFHYLNTVYFSTNPHDNYTHSVVIYIKVKVATKLSLILKDKSKVND
jgi:hypothetical protein